MNRLHVVNPPNLDAPRGFSHGIVAPPGMRLLFVAGQTAADGGGRIADRAFTAQFDRALEKVLAVVEAAGGGAGQICSVRIFVTDLDAYVRSRPALTDVWRRRMAGHYPAMALVEVRRLVDADATLEIEAIAAIP